MRAEATPPRGHREDTARVDAMLTFSHAQLTTNLPRLHLQQEDISAKTVNSGKKKLLNNRKQKKIQKLIDKKSWFLAKKEVYKLLVRNSGYVEDDHEDPDIVNWHERIDEFMSNPNAPEDVKKFISDMDAAEQDDTEKRRQRYMKALSQERL